VVAGLVSTLITAPMDMIKTRLMLQQGSESTKTYRNGFHCGYKVMFSSPSINTFSLSIACLLALIVNEYDISGCSQRRSSGTLQRVKKKKPSCS